MRTCDTFFQAMEQLGLALTFQDVRLKTGPSEVLPAHVSLKTRFAQRTPLRIPIVSAAMDTVTEAKMAIALAQLGGLGVLHRRLTASEQARHVARVKFHLNGLIERPICVAEHETVAAVQGRRDEKQYAFHSFPVLNSSERLVGLLSRSDFDFCNDPQLPARSVMTPLEELVTAPPTTTVEQAYDIMCQHKKKLLPLVDGENRLAGMYVFSDVVRICRSDNGQMANVDGKGQLRVGAAIGTGSGDLERLGLLTEKGVDVVVIDTAHGDSRPVYEMLSAIRRDCAFNGVDVVVGNVSEGASARRLAEAGADGIKVGQGPGSICTTRIVAGVGCPQVTAIYDCKRALTGHDVPIIADGGLVSSGDIVIALGAGADCVMLGRMLAGTEETPGRLSFYRGAKVKDYRGMGSLGAMECSAAARDRYRQAGLSRDKLVPEGVEGVVAYQGLLCDVVHQCIGGLRSGMGYVGAATIKELQEKADFHRISVAGLGESHPHDVIVTRDVPNYPREL